MKENRQKNKFETWKNTVAVPLFDRQGEITGCLFSAIYFDEVLDCDYVLGRLGFDELSDQGYDYELWRVEPQNGAKEVVVCPREGIDFSHAEKNRILLARAGRTVRRTRK